MDYGTFLGYKIIVEPKGRSFTYRVVEKWQKGDVELELPTDIYNSVAEIGHAVHWALKDLEKKYNIKLEVQDGTLD